MFFAVSRLKFTDEYFYVSRVISHSSHFPLSQHPSLTRSSQMAEDLYKMQGFSIGLEKLDSHTFTLACKENILPAAKLRGPTSYQLLSDQTPPTADQENTSPVPRQNGPTRKPLPFTSVGSQFSRPFSMLQHYAAGFSLAVDGPRSPLPYFAWADSSKLWQEMRSKDTSKAAPESELRLRHPCILPNMRTILLDWMMEVRHCIKPPCACIIIILNTVYLSCIQHYHNIGDTGRCKIHSSLVCVGYARLAFV